MFLERAARLLLTSHSSSATACSVHAAAARLGFAVRTNRQEWSWPMQNAKWLGREASGGQTSRLANFCDLYRGTVNFVCAPYRALRWNYFVVENNKFTVAKIHLLHRHVSVTLVTIFRVLYTDTYPSHCARKNALTGCSRPYTSLNNIINKTYFTQF